jgi:microsomal prostaglandin-E synthase 2
VRSVLDYLKINYEVVEVHPLSKAETKDFASDYAKVPILRIDAPDQPVQLRDSKTILRALLGARAGSSEDAPPPKATPSTVLMWPAEEGTGGVEDQWIKWTDRVLVQCIVINIYRNYAESAETFKYLLTHPTFSWFQQQSAAVSGTVVMWAVALARKSKYKVKDERGALYEACNEYSEAVKAKGSTFLGGEKPGLADFNVYGILRSVESFTTERDLFQNCPAVWTWYQAMSQTVGPSCAVNASDIKRGA